MIADKSKHYFRVKFGFQPQEQVSVTGTDLAKAIYAQIKNATVMVGGMSIKGNYIQSIVPDYHKHTGWHDWYVPQDGDDWTQIQRDCPNYDGVLEIMKEKVMYLIQNGQEEKIKDQKFLEELKINNQII